MSKVLGFIFAMLLFVGTCEAAVFSWTVQTTAMVGGFSGNLANVSSTGTPTGDFNPNPTSYVTGNSSNGRLKGEAYNPVVYPPSLGFANYQVHSKVDAIWGTKLDFAAQSAVVSNPTPYDVTVETKGEFFFSVSNSASGTYNVAKSGSLSLFKDVSGSWTPFANSGNIADVNGNFKIVFDVIFSSTALNTTGDTTDLLTLEAGVLSPPVVPEPASMAVFGMLGFAGFAARRFRKK
jgi:hypothetical protein